MEATEELAAKTATAEKLREQILDMEDALDAFVEATEAEVEKLRNGIAVAKSHLKVMFEEIEAQKPKAKDHER